VDTVDMGEAVEEAERLRDPSHVRNYTEEEWRELVTGAGLAIDELEIFAHAFDVHAWLSRTGCEGEDAERVLSLLGDRVAEGRLTLDKIAIKAAKGR
jgi:hypothetical protein